MCKVDYSETSLATYLALLKRRLECYFDVVQNAVFNGRTYELSASYSSRENQTLLTKEAVMDYLDTKELCLVSSVNGAFSEENAVSCVNKQLSSLPSFALSYSGQLSRHHKSTTVTIAFVEETGCTKDEIQAVKHFHFHKLHRFGFWGVTDAYAVLVDLESNSVYCSRFASAKRKVFNPIVKNGKK
jgi:hypothetical protein